MNIDKSEIENFDNYAHEWWNKRGPYKFIHLLTPIRLRYISDNLNLKGSKILDLGCGGGLLCEAMTNSGADVIGIDASLKTIEIAKKHAKEQNFKIEYINTDIESYDNKEKFDAVVCFELIEHVPDPNELIKQIRRLIKPNGRLFLSTINRNLFSFMFAKLVAEYLLNIIPRGTHTYEKFIKPSELASWARGSGLIVEKSIGMTYNPISRVYKLAKKDLSVNYLMKLTKPK